MSLFKKEKGDNMTTATIKALMDLKKEFPINNINNRKRYSPEEINKIIDNKINEVLEDLK